MTTIVASGIRFQLGSDAPYATGYGDDDGIPVVRVWDCLRQGWTITTGGLPAAVVETIRPEEWAAIQSHCGPRPGCRRQ